jgi:hypothetical protein
MPKIPEYFMEWDYKKIPITPDSILAWANEKNYIQLIKAVRVILGKGLKDSKDLVDFNCKTDGTRLINKEKTVQFFSQFFQPVPTPEEIEEANLERKDAQETKWILFGIECICKNWKTLGYPNKFTACKIVIDNLKKQYQ